VVRDGPGAGGIAAAGDSWRRDRAEHIANTEVGRVAVPAFRRSGDAQSVEVLRRVVDRDISVLLLGETARQGYCARAIHAASRRADKPFLSVNCGAIPEPLIESELFGHKPPPSPVLRASGSWPHPAGERRHAVPRRDRRHAAALQAAS